MQPVLGQVNLRWKWKHYFRRTITSKALSSKLFSGP